MSRRAAFLAPVDPDACADRFARCVRLFRDEGAIVRPFENEGEAVAAPLVGEPKEALQGFPLANPPVRDTGADHLKSNREGRVSRVPVHVRALRLISSNTPPPVINQ